MMMMKTMTGSQGGYSGLFAAQAIRTDVTTDDYAKAQDDFQSGKAKAFVLPLIREKPARTLLDVGCGMGGMAVALEAEGYESYGIDLPGLERRWAAAGRRADRFYLVDPDRFELPFLDGSIDFAFTFGVIEHVGTTDGHADRRADYHEVRRHWLREIYRVLSPGGRMLIGGPNRRFPFDVAHGPDSRAPAWERWLSRKAGMTVHRTWGDNFLWAYEDVPRYLDGLPCSIEARGVTGFLDFSRAPGFAREAVRAYVRHLPKSLLGTGLNPWVMAVVTRTG